jgi:RHS repeat-associated protein
MRTSLISATTRKQRRKRGKRFRPLLLEALEDRRLLTLFDLTPITNRTDGQSLNPDISNSADLVVFDSNADHTGGNPDLNNEIYLYRRSTDAFTQLTDTAAPDTNINPKISGDGSTVLFRAFRNNSADSDLILFDVASGTSTPITAANDSTSNSSFGSISEDGSLVALLSQSDLTGGNTDGGPDVFLYNVSAGTFQQITDASLFSTVGIPVISGDGSRVGFFSNINLGNNADGDRELIMFDISSASLTQVTDTTNNFNASELQLNRDGTVGVFTSTINLSNQNDDGNFEVFRVDTTTGESTQITDTTPGGNAGGNSAPLITGDGTQVFFISDADPAGDNPERTSQVYRFTNPTIAATDSPDDVFQASISDSGQSLAGTTFDGVIHDIFIGTIPPRPPSTFARSQEPLCVCCCDDGDSNDTGPNSVYLDHGGFITAATDLAIPGRGLDWEFHRKYRSAKSFDGPLGNNWEFNYNQRLVEVTGVNLAEFAEDFPDAQPGDVVRVDGDGRRDLYLQNANGSYQAPTFFYTRLVKHPDNSFTERHPDGDVVTYLPRDAQGIARLATMSDRNRNTLQFQYNSQNQLDRVIDTLGRPIDYAYNETGLLNEVTDFIGRAITFEYDENGDLVAVTSPAVMGTPNGNDFPNGKTVRYTYSSGFGDERLNHNLLSITAPNEVAAGGPPQTIITYDENSNSPHIDRVLTQTIGGTNGSGVPSGGIISYTYQNLGPAQADDFDSAVFQTSVTDRNGNETEYQFNQLGNIVRVRESSNRDIRPNDPEIFEESRQYNADDERLEQLKPEGNRTQFTFDENNPDRLQQGNMLRSVRASDAERGGDQQQLVTSYAYEPIYNQVRLSTDARGNDPDFRPAIELPGETFPNPARYTMTRTFDYQEGTDFDGLATMLGMTAAEVQQLLQDIGISMGLGDVNGDGRTDQIAGNILRTEYPTVHLRPDSNQASVEQATDQAIVEMSVYNDFGQMTRRVDPEGNMTEYAYYAENDPNGDGVIDNPIGNSTTGGYPRQVTRDTTSNPDRNSGTNPTPVEVRNVYEYDAVGNVTREVDGRGIATDYFVNELNQVVQITRTAAHGLLVPNPPEPLPLTNFQYLGRTFYDFNDNVVQRQIEDRGNTSHTDVFTLDPDNDGNAEALADGILTLRFLAGFSGNSLVESVVNPNGTRTDPTQIANLLGGPLATMIDFDGNGVRDALTDGIVFLRLLNGFTGQALVEGAVDPNGTRTTAEEIMNFVNPLLPTGQPSVYFIDSMYEYDILDQLVESSQEVDTEETLVTRYRYDPNGNQVLTILPEGNATSATFDERDLLFQTTRGTLAPPPLALLSPTDPTSYDVRGGILCQCTTYHYDGNRNLIETVDAADTDGSADNNSDLGGPGDRTRYVYDGFDRQTSVIDAVGNQSVTQFDPVGNVIRASQFGPVGGASPTDDGPDALAGPVSIAGVIQSANLVNNNLLAATEHLHDELNRPIQTDRVLFVNTTGTERSADVADGAADLGKENLTPNDDHAIPGLAGIDILGRVSRRTEYDRSSRVTFTVEDDGDTSRSFYDGADRVIQRVDPEGNRVEYAYDDSNNLIETRETDVAQVVGVADEVFLTTVFYDSLNRPQQSVNNIGQAMQYRYDSRNNMVAMVDSQGPVTGQSITRRAFSDGTLTVNQINDFGNVTLYTYDGISRRTRQEVLLTESGDGDGANIGADIFGVKSATPAVESSQGGGDGIIRIGTSYDQNSLVSSLIDDNGNVTLYLYDNLNRQVTETKGATVDTTLDKAAILGEREIATPTAETIDDPAVIPTDQINQQLQRAKSRIDSVAALFPPLADTADPPTTIVYGYDQENNLSILEDENDNEHLTAYDALNRPIARRIFRSGQNDSHVSDPLFAPNPMNDPSNVTNVPVIVGTTKQDYQYDGLSRMVQAMDNNDPANAADDSVITYAYDSLSRQFEENQQIGSLPAQTISTGWRAENLQSTLAYPNDRVVEYTYDDLDRLNTITDQGAALPIVDYDYVGTSRVLQRRYPLNGTRMTYLDDAGTADSGYDGLRRPVELRHLRNDNSLIVGFTHSYDRMNNKLTEGKLHDDANSEVYSYDSAYRLTSFDRPNAGAIEPQQSDWTLDGVGSWQQVDGETREHSSFNEIVSRDSTTLQHDDSGNQTDDGTLQYQWDAMNRLARVTRKSDGNVIAEYSYDAANRRIRKVVANSGDLHSTTDFYYAGWQVLEERDGADQLTQQFVYGNYIDEPLVMDRNIDGGNSATDAGDQRFFYHQNSQFSVFALTETSAEIAEAYQYEPFGGQTVFQGGPDGVVQFSSENVTGTVSSENPYAFTGRRIDVETQLLFFRNRYFATEQGRFASRDPFGFTDGINLYAGYFVPNGVDPSGLKNLSDHIKETFFNSGGLSHTGKIVTIPLWGPAVTFNVDGTIAGDFKRCCDTASGKFRYYLELAGTLEFYVMAGHSFRPNRPSGFSDNGSARRAANRGGHRNERIPHPQNPGQTIRRKDLPREGFPEDPRPGFRERWGNMTFNDSVGPCPAARWDISGELFLRGSVGFGGGAQFNISQEISSDFDPIHGWDLEGSFGFGIYGASLEAGGGVTVSAIIYQF